VVRLAHWLQTTASSLRALAERPMILFLFLLALNALSYPYAGLTHDAYLYSMQVLNRMENGAYNTDLFFLHGSQDSFSIFSPAVAPLASLLGLEWTFFLLYILGTGLFILALQRFVRALLPDPLLAVISLIYLVSTPIFYGGFGSFHVLEPFLTPRLLANCLVLFALEQLLRERYVLSLVLLVLGCLIHPLMSFGALLVLPLVLALRWLRPRTALIIGLLGAFGVALVLAYPPLGYRVFGRMDDEWLQVVELVSPYLFPLQWGVDDWANVIISQVVVTVAAVVLLRSSPRLGWLVLAVALVALGGMVANVIGSVMGYRLLLQGQPYRFLWVVRLLQVPLTLHLAAQLYRQGDEPRRWLALALLCTLTPAIMMSQELLCFGICLVILVFLYRFLEISRPALPSWSLLVAISLVVGLIGGALVREAVLVSLVPSALARMEILDVWLILILNLGILVWLGLSGLFLNALRQRWGLGTQGTLLLAGAFAGLQLLPFLLRISDWYQDRYRRNGQDVRFMADFLSHQQRPEGRPFCLYWSEGEFNTIWLDLRSVSYFAQQHQLQGAVFNRATAMEGKRRALIVRRFELDFLKSVPDWVDPVLVKKIEALFELDLASSAPASQEDLAALCQDETVDFAILPTRYADLPSASNGRIHIYDCRRLRHRLAASTSER
jgi:hypothetical protein